MTAVVLERSRPAHVGAHHAENGHARGGGMGNLRPACRHHPRYVAGCDDCRTANAARKRARARLIAYGQWESLTDAAPVRAHLKALAAVGVTRDAIAQVSGVGRSTLACIAAGQSTVQAVTARAVLAVVGAPKPTARISSLGTARRLQALMAIGWDATSVAARLGVQAHQVRQWRARAFQQIAYRRHRQIAALYRELECRPGPSDTDRVRAAAFGYAPPVHWDDDGDLDHPNARPKGARKAAV